MKFGLTQLNKEAPKWLTFLSDYSIIVLGAFAIYSTQIPDSYINSDLKNLLGSTATFIVAILKGIEMLSGKK